MLPLVPANKLPIPFTPPLEKIVASIDGVIFNVVALAEPTQATKAIETKILFIFLVLNGKALDGIDAIEHVARQIVDMTAQWMPFVIERACAYRARLHEHRALHGRPMTDALVTFYDGVATLFRGGSFGGLRVTAKRA